MCWLSTIQSCRLESPLGIVTAASVVRLPTWVRSGPTSLFAFVPRIVWQLEHEPSWKTRAPPAGGPPPGGGAGPPPLRAPLPDPPPPPGGAPGRPAVGEPLAELALRLREHVEVHVRVLEPAELGAGAAVAAGR